MRYDRRTRYVAGACLVAMLAATMGSPATAAKRRDTGPVYAMDDAFRADLTGAQAALTQGDSITAQQRAQSLLATADQPVEKYAASGLLLEAASQRGDTKAERGAITALLETGQVPQAQAARLRAAAGVLSATLGDRRDAIAQIEYANGQGYASTTSQIVLADAKFQQKDVDGGARAFEEALALRGKEGKAIEPAWYDRVIALAYQRKRFDLVERWTRAKLAAQASPAGWRSAIINYMAGAGTGPDQALDLYRLMATTDALASERDWQAYSAVAADHGSGAEAKAALDTGLKANDLDASAPAVQKSLVALKPRAAKALAEIPALTAKAAKAGTGTAALAAADAQFAAAAYPAAVPLYRMAIAKGGVDAGRASTRLGIALARSGDLAGGKAQLTTVTDGPWAPVAGFWSVWIDRQLARNPV